MSEMRERKEGEWVENGNEGRERGEKEPRSQTANRLTTPEKLRKRDNHNEPEKITQRFLSHGLPHTFSRYNRGGGIAGHSGNSQVTPETTIPTPRTFPGRSGVVSRAISPEAQPSRTPSGRARNLKHSPLVHTAPRHSNHTINKR